MTFRHVITGELRTVEISKHSWVWIHADGEVTDRYLGDRQSGRDYVEILLTMGFERVQVAGT